MMRILKEVRVVRRNATIMFRPGVDELRPVRDGKVRSGLEYPKSSGKEEEYQVWITKFEAYAKVKGFYTVMAGTEVPPLVSQATKTAPELKVEEYWVLYHASGDGQHRKGVHDGRSCEDDGASSRMLEESVRRHQDDIRA